MKKIFLRHLFVLLDENVKFGIIYKSNYMFYICFLKNRWKGHCMKKLIAFLLAATMLIGLAA